MQRLRKLDVYLLSGLKAAAVTILKKILKPDLLLCVVSIHPQPTVSSYIGPPSGCLLCKLFSFCSLFHFLLTDSWKLVIPGLAICVLRKFCGFLFLLFIILALALKESSRVLVNVLNVGSVKASIPENTPTCVLWL